MLPWLLTLLWRLFEVQRGGFLQLLGNPHTTVGLLCGGKFGFWGVAVWEWGLYSNRGDRLTDLTVAKWLG